MVFLSVRHSIIIKRHGLHYKGFSVPVPFQYQTIAFWFNMFAAVFFHLPNNFKFYMINYINNNGG